MSRARITGFKRKLVGDDSEKAAGDASRAHKSNIILSEIIPCAIYSAGCFVAFTFINAQTGVKATDDDRVNSTLRIIICTVGPIVVNLGILCFCAGMACCCGPLFKMCCKSSGSVMAGICHGFSVIIHIAFFIVMWVLEGFHFARMLIGVVTCIQCERLIFSCMTTFMLTREFKNDRSNTAFWTGKWYGMGIGAMAWSQPYRELCAKTIEMSEFAADFVLGHTILFAQFPVLCIPYIDKFHSIMLFWLKPSRQIRPPIYSLKQTRLRKRMVKKYSWLYYTVFCLFVACIVGPAAASSHVPKDIGSSVTGTFKNIVQPRGKDNNDTGLQMSTYVSHWYTSTPSLKTWSTKR